MSDSPNPIDGLFDLALESRQSLSEVTRGLFLLNVVTLSLLVDLKVIEREAIVSRLHEFLDTMPEEPRNGLADLLLRSAIKMFQPGAPLPDPKTLFEVIDGGLSPRDQGQEPHQDDP